MATRYLALALAAAGVLQACSMPPPLARAGAERLYVLDCGEGTAPDVSRWSPGVNVGKPVDFVDTCYLVKHAGGWLLWDTGVPDAVASMPDGLPPADPKATRWHRAKTLAAQIEQLQVRPSDIRYVAISHSHPDHIGNLAMFPASTLLVQQAEYDWPGTGGSPRFGATPPMQKLAGDRDVFADGSVTIISTPGHTPGHQSLLVKLPKTGAVLLSGDAVHFRDNWEHRRIPSINFDKEQTAASMQRLADIAAREAAQLWINHDKAQRSELKLSPQFYD